MRGEQRKVKEESVHMQVATWLKLQWKRVVFRTDFAAGIKMTMGQAVRHKKIQHGRSYPDLFIARARGGYFGMYMEIKRDASEVFLKDGVTLKANPHIHEQAEMLETLREEGYYCVWGLGFDDAIKKISEYLTNKK